MAWSRLCAGCIGRFRVAPRRLVGGLDVISAFVHDGPARRLVHHLKFGGIGAAAELMADLMAPMVGPCSALVPVPRSQWRRLRYGVDTGAVLADALGRRLGVPVVAGLSPSLTNRSHTGRPREGRSPPRFVCVSPVPGGAVLVDDVLTTGSTLLAAARSSGIVRAATFTVASR